jgi:stage II sporulation protein AA (anti-sigma F factor antagonist)
VDAYKNILFRKNDECHQLKVPGPDFVMEQAQDLVDLVFDENPEGPKDIILDLTDVNYINSSGISVVIRLNIERSLRLVNPSPMVREILELTGVLPFVPLYTTMDEAVASL